MIKKALLTTYLACLVLLGTSSSIYSQNGNSSFDLGNKINFGFNPSSSSSSKSSLISSVSSIAPGDSFTVALKLTHPVGWHSYYHNDGIGISKSPAITWTYPDGFIASSLTFPTPHRFKSSGFTSYGYEGTNYFITDITAPKDLAVGETVTLTADATWQLCKESCKNEDGKHSINIVCATQTITNPTFTSELADYQKKYLPASTPEEWKISAASINGNIDLNIDSENKLPDDLEFYEYDGQLDAQKEIKITPSGNSLTISGTFNQGNDLTSGPAKGLDHISGILHSPSSALTGDKHSVFVSTQWDAPSEKIIPINNLQVNEGIHDEHTPTSIVENDLSALEIAEKYDIDSKVSIITLDRIDDEGNALDDDGNIIAKEELFTDGEGNIVNKDGEITGELEKTTFFYAALLIFGGGLILNLMPCVFPVLGVKVLGFVQLSGNDPKKIKKHGIAFTLGVVVSMWILATVILIIRDSAGQGVAWGSQMKNPIFVGCMIILMALFALNLYGVFEVGTSLTSAGGKLHAKKGYEGSFFSGVLTTLIATPCGAPLLATAMTYTLQQTIFLALILFTIFGLGVAAPYLLLSFFPALINKLPRPGAWMVTFKKSMSFLLLATVVFLMNTYVAQTGADGIILMLWALVILATAGFIYGTWGTPMISALKRRIIGYGIASLFAVWGGYLGYQSMLIKPEAKVQNLASNSAIIKTEAEDIHSWANWVPGLVDHQRSKKRIVWIDYTADW